MDDDGAGCPVSFAKISEALKNLCSSCTKDRLSSLLTVDGVKTVLAAFEGFCTESSAEQPLFAFWNSYLEMVELLLSFVRALREGNWDLHVACLRKLLPCFLRITESIVRVT